VVLVEAREKRVDAFANRREPVASLDQGARVDVRAWREEEEENGPARGRELGAGPQDGSARIAEAEERDAKEQKRDIWAGSVMPIAHTTL